MNACEQSVPQQPPPDGLNLRGSVDENGPRRRWRARPSTYGVGSNGSSFATPANGQQVQLRTEWPHASFVVLPEAASTASALSASASATKWDCMFWRVEAWPLPRAE